MDVWQVIGVVGGIIGVLICVGMAIAAFSEDNVGAGVALLIAAPLAYFIASALAVLIVVGALIAFAVYAISETSG
jgi:hypothetical protein